jgi:hypothetical protein
VGCGGAFLNVHDEEPRALFHRVHVVLRQFDQLRGPGHAGSYAAALLYVDANALGAIFCYLVLVGEIKRLELKSLE